jgi:hypothetical protein
MISIEQLGPVAVVLAGVLAGANTVLSARRSRILLLAVQYVCFTIVAAMSLSLKIAIIKCFAGWIACAILWQSLGYIRKSPMSQDERALPSGWIFRMIAVLLVSTAALGAGKNPLLEIDTDPLIVAASILLGGLGLLQLGLKETPMGIGVGLLTLLSGFEIFYSVLEPSIAVLGLFAAVHVGIGIAVSILEIDTVPKESQEDRTP